MADQWGAISIPTAASSYGAAGDPCLSTILDFLRAFVTTDGNATAVWQSVFPAKPPIASVFPHNPTEVAFSVNQLPALFLWRESGKNEWIADDWLRATTLVKGLWVFPLATQENQRQRVTFTNALVKSLEIGIERGRTPSWVQIGDTDPLAASLGSLMYTYAGFEGFSFESWRAAKLVIPAMDGAGSEAFPAVELTFQMQENLVYDPARWAALSRMDGEYTTITNDGGVVVNVGQGPNAYQGSGAQPIAWLDPAAVNVTLSATGAVTQVTNLVEGASPWVPGSDGAPTWSATGFNKKPGFVWPGDARRRLIAPISAFAGTPPALSTGFTLVAAVSSGLALTKTGNVAETYRTGDNLTGYTVTAGKDATGNNFGGARYGVASDAADIAARFGAGPCVLSWIFDPLLGVRIRVNGALVASQSAAPASGAVPQQNFVVLGGASDAQDTAFGQIVNFVGSMGRVFVFNAALSNADLVSWEARAVAT